MEPGPVVSAGPGSLKDLSALVFWSSKMCLRKKFVLPCLSLPGTGTAGKPEVHKHREQGACLQYSESL